MRKTPRRTVARAEAADGRAPSLALLAEELSEAFDRAEAEVECEVGGVPAAGGQRWRFRRSRSVPCADHVAFNPRGRHKGDEL